MGRAAVGWKNTEYAACPVATGRAGVERGNTTAYGAASDNSDGNHVK